MRISRMIVGLALASSCGKGTPAPSASDALWALAPAGARGGVVISPRGLGMIEDGFTMVRGILATVPELAPVNAQLAALTAPLGGPELALADFGFSRSQGAALFLLPDGMVAILPVTDRDKFLAKVHGTKGDVDRIATNTCKLVRAHYACATSEAALATLGEGALKQPFTEARARGEIEIVGIDLPFGEAQATTVAAALQLARGAITLRAALVHPPAELTDRLATTGTASIDPQRTAGFALLDLKAFIPKSEQVVLDGITLAQVVDTFAGMLSITAPAGEQALVMELPLNDPAPLRTIVERCDQLPGAEAIQAHVSARTCTIAVPNWGLTLDLWVEGQQLHVGKRAAPVTGKPVVITPLGRELARGSWALAFWGRGTMLASPPQGLDAPDLPPDGMVLVRALALVNELGFGVRRQGDRIELVAGVRTALANPDDVVAKLVAISAGDVVASRARAAAAPIATAAPSSPFATDFAAGASGLLVPTTLVGAGATFVIPALMRYRQSVEPGE